MNKRMNGVRLLAVAMLGVCGLAHAASAYRYVNCSACATRIPDSTGATDGIVTATFNVPAGVCPASTVTGFALQLDVMHSNVGDLRVSLKNPGGAVNVTVLNRPLSGGSCKADDISATFLDGGATVACGNLIPALAGDLKSSSALSAFGTTATPGTWQAEVRDQAPGGDGFLTNAQLRMKCGYTDVIFADSFERP